MALHGPLISVQVSPALVERYTPLLELPKISPRPAYWLLKLLGSTSRSVATPFNFCDQVTPPSVDLKIPLAGVDGGNTALRPAKPCAVAASTMSGFVGCTLISLKVAFAKVKVARSCQVVPPSADFKSPSPAYESPEKLASPVPA